MEPNGIVMERAEVMTQAKAHRLSRGMLLLATGLLLVVMGDRRALTQVSRGIDPLEILNLQVKPNVIVVLDSSGSMNENLVSPPTWVSGDYERAKMFLAKKVLNRVVAENADKVNFLFGQYSQGATTMQDALQGGSSYDRFYYSANSYDYPNMLDVEVSLNREPGTDSTATISAGANDSIEFYERVDTGTTTRTYVACSFAVPAATYLGDVDMSGLAIYIQARMTNPYPADVTCTKNGPSANNAQNSYQLDWDVANQRFWIKRSGGSNGFQLRFASAAATAGPTLGFASNVPNVVAPPPINATSFGNTYWRTVDTAYNGAVLGILGAQSRGFEAWRDIRAAWNQFYFREATTNCSFTIDTAPSPPGLYPKGADFALQLQNKMNGAGGQPNPCGSLSPRNTYTVQYNGPRGQFWFTRTAGGNAVTLQWSSQTTNSVRSAINAASNAAGTFVDINLVTPGTNNCPTTGTPLPLPNSYCTRENPLLRRFTSNDPIGNVFFKLIESYDPDGTGPQPTQAISHYLLRAGKFFNGEIFQVTGSGGLCAMRMGTVQTPPALPQVTLEQVNTCAGVVENTVVFKWAGADFSGGGCGNFDSRVPLASCSQAGSIQLSAIQPFLAGQDIFNADGTMKGYAEDNLGWFRTTTYPNNPAGSNVNGGIRATGNTPIAQSLIDIKGIFTALWNTGQATPPLTPISTHVDPKERTIVIFLTDGNDTCASGSTSTADRALNAAYRAQLLYQRVDAAQVASSVTTYMVGFGSGADTGMLNQIAWGGSGMTTWPVSGGQWTAPGPTQAYKDVNCPTCTDAFIAPSAEELKVIIDNIINQGATFGDYTAQGSLIQPIFEYVGEVPASGGTTYDPYRSESRYTGVVPLKFKSVFSMPEFQGHVYAINSDLSNRWDAGAKLTSRVQQGLSTTACTVDGSAGEATFANITSGSPCFIDRRIYSTGSNGVFSVAAADLVDPTWVQSNGNRISIWPPASSVNPSSGNGVLDAALGLPMTDDAAAWTQLTTKYEACMGTGAPAACSGADATRVPAARKEARQIILAYMAGAKLAPDNTGAPKRTSATHATPGVLLFKARTWVLSESTLADSAIVGPPLDAIPNGVYSGEYKFFRDGFKGVSGLPIDNLLAGFGLRNPDVDSTGVDASTTMVPVMSVIYVAANDMLHAFRAGSSITTTTQTSCVASGTVDCGGEELWGFVPFDQLSKLKDLLQPQTRNNKTFVLASPVRFSDVFVPNPGTTSNPSGTLTFNGQGLAGVWRKILIVGRGIAGKYYTALDVTAPGPFTTRATATQAPVVYWSRGNPDTDTGLPSGSAGTALNHDSADYQAYSQMGETWSVPAIAYVNKVHSARKPCTGGGTVGLPCSNASGGGVEFLAFMGSGYSDVASEGHTFFGLDVLTGDVVSSADIGSRSAAPAGGYANALVANAVSYAPNQFQARQAGHPFDSSAKTSRVYIGDLHGRLWKFLTSALTTPILFQDLGVDQPIGTPVALIKLPPTIPPDFSGDSHVFVVTGNDTRATISTGQFRYYGFKDTGGDNDTTPPSNLTSCIPTLEDPCLFWGEFTDSTNPALGGFRGTVQPATVFEGEGAVPMRGRVFLVGTRFVPPPPLSPLSTPVPPYPCRSRFDSIVFALGATTGGAAYDLNATGDDRYVVFDNSRLVAASIVTDPRLPGGAQLFLDEGIYNPAVPEQPPPDPGPTPILGSSVRTGSSITGSTVCK